MGGGREVFTRVNSGASASVLLLEQSKEPRAVESILRALFSTGEWSV